MEFDLSADQVDATFAVAMAAAPAAVRAMLQDARSRALVDGQVSLNALLESLEQRSGELEAEASKMEQIREWYSERTSELEQQAGVKVRKVEYLRGQGGMLITVEIFPTGTEDALEESEDIGVLQITLTSSMKLKDAKLDLATGRSLDISEALTAAQAMAAPVDLKYLTIECGRRVRSSIIRQRHIKALQERYLVARSVPHQLTKMVPATETLLVTLAPGVVVRVHVTPEYPFTPASVCVLELVGALNWRSDELRGVERQINAEQHHDLVSLVGRLDSVLRDVDPMIDDPETGNPIRKA
eukprot:scaffold1476_cov264-Pinguiococcus_pyrenoidosus.AAC.4